MTTDTLLTQLRYRLTRVQARIAEHEQMRDDPDSNNLHQLHAAGALTELRCEQLFLAGMIEQMHKAVGA